MSDQQLLVPIRDTMMILGGISRTTLHKLINDGEIVTARIGRRTFITRTSIDAYVDRVSDTP